MYNACVLMNCLMNALTEVIIGVTMYCIMGCYDEHKIQQNLT